MEVTIKIDKRSKQAKALYEYLKSLPYVKVEEREFNQKTKNAIEEAASGKNLEEIKDVHAFIEGL